MAKTVDVPTERKLVSYRYIATTIQGKSVKGTIKASSEIAAERLVIEQGLTPISVEVIPSMWSLEEALPSLFKIKPRDVIIFSRQLSTLIRSGISLLPALEILQDQVAASRAFKNIVKSIVTDIRAGSSFSVAIAKHPLAFSEIYSKTIAVGEHSGHLETILNEMADFEEKQGAIAKKMRAALAYPVMVMGVGVVVVIILMTVVMPNLIGMFTSMSVELPMPTKVIIALTGVFTNYTIYLLIGVAVLVALVLWMVKQPAGRRLLDQIQLKAPIIGPPILMGELGRFSRTMSVLVGAGVKLQEIMEMAQQASTNSVIRDALRRVNEGLILGEGLSGPMSHIDLFPSLLVQMVAVGEETNTLDFTMGVVADFYETTAEEKTAAMVGMVGPLATIVIAGMVGFIAMAVLMPIYTLTGAIE